VSPSVFSDEVTLGVFSELSALSYCKDDVLMTVTIPHFSKSSKIANIKYTHGWDL
jgi:hypothetical protein